MSFERIVGSVKHFLRKNCPTFDSSRIFLSQAQSEAICEHLFLDSNFLSRLGFPLIVAESTLGNTSIFIKPSLSEDSKITASIKSLELSASPFDNYIYDDAVAIEMMNVDVEISNFRLTLFTQAKNTDCILFTSSHISASIKKDHTGTIDIEGLSIFIGCEPILDKINVKLDLRQNDKIPFFDCTLDLLDINLASPQFLAFIELWKSFTSKNFVSNTIHFSIKNVNALLGNGTSALINNLQIRIGNETCFKIESMKLNISTVIFDLDDIVYNKTEVKIGKISMQKHSRISMGNCNEPFLIGSLNQINISEFSLTSDPAFYAFFLSSIRENLMFNFMIKNNNIEQARKIELKKATFVIIKGLTISFSLACFMKKQIDQFNFTQFSIANEDLLPITEDQIMQIIILHKSECKCFSFFTSPLNVNISFDELKKLHVFCKQFIKHYKVNDVKYLYDLNLPDCEVFIGTKYGKEMEPSFRFGLSSITIKGTIEGGALKYNCSPSIYLHYFEKEHSNWQPLLDNFTLNMIYAVEGKKQTFNIVAPNTLYSNISYKFLAFMNSISSKHDLFAEKEVVLKNSTSNEIKIYTDSDSIVLPPKKKISYQHKHIGFSKSLSKVAIINLFSGLLIDKDKMVILNNQKKQFQISICSRQVIRNSLPISISVFAANPLVPKPALILKPGEEKPLNTYLTYIIFACDEICAKASDYIQPKDSQTYMLIANGVQTTCVVEKIDINIIEIRSFFKIVNELGFKIFARMSSANIPIEVDVKDEKTILLPYYESLPIDIEIAFIPKQFSGLVSVGNELKLPLQTGNYMVNTIPRFNKSGQMEIIIRPKYSVINRSTVPLFVVNGKEHYSLDPSTTGQKPPYFHGKEFIGLISNPGLQISVSGATASVDLPSKESKIMLLPLKTNSTLFYPLYCEANDHSVTIFEAIMINNLIDYKITLETNGIIFLEFNPQETGRISIVNSEAIVSIAIDGYKSCEKVLLTYETSTTLHFRGEKHLFVDFTSVFTDHGYEITLSPPKADPRFVFINNSCYETKIVQQSYEFPLSVSPHSSTVFGFVSPFQKSVVNILIEDKSYQLSFTDAIMQCIHDKYPIFITTRSLANGSRALVFGDADDDCLDPLDITFTIPDFYLSYGDNKAEILSILMNNISFQLSTKGLFRDLSLSIGTLNMHHFESNKSNHLFESLPSSHPIIAMKATFNTTIDLSCLWYFSFLIRDFTLRYNSITGESLKEIAAMIGKIDTRKLIVAEDVTIHPIQFHFNNDKKYSNTVMFPAAMMHGVNSSFGGFLTVLNSLYSKLFHNFESTIMHKEPIVMQIEYPDSIITSFLPGFYHPDIAVIGEPHVLSVWTPFENIHYEECPVLKARIMKGSDEFKEWNETEQKPKKPKEYKLSMISSVPDLIEQLCKEPIYLIVKSMSGKRVFALGKTSFFSVDLSGKIARIYPYASTLPTGVKEDKVSFVDASNTKILIPFSNSNEAEKFFLLTWTMRLDL